MIPSKCHPLPYLKPKEGSLCIYCPNPLSNKSAEHLFNSSFGGRIQSRDIDCHLCNQYFSDSVDVAFNDLLQKVKNVRALITERNKKAPSIKLEDGSILAPYGEPILIQNAVLQIKEHDDNTFSFRIDGIDTERKAKKILRDFAQIEAHIGHSLNHAQKDFLINVKGIQIEKETVIKEIHGSHIVESNIPMQTRCIANTCLKTLAHFQPELARNDIFDPIRKFVRYGTGNWQNFALDAILDPFFTPTRFQFYFHTFNHVVIYFSQRLNKVIGIFTMLGMVRRAVILAEEWGAPEGLLIIDEDCKKNPPEIRCRYYEFVVDAGLPEIVNIKDAQLDEKFFYNELLTLEKEIRALGPAYMYSDYLKELEDQNGPFSEKMMNEFHDMTVKHLSTALKNFDGQFVPDAEILSVLNDCNFNAFKAKFLGCFPNDEFHSELMEISKGVMLKIKPEIKFLERN